MTIASQHTIPQAAFQPRGSTWPAASNMLHQSHSSKVVAPALSGINWPVVLESRQPIGPNEKLPWVPVDAQRAISAGLTVLTNPVLVREL